MNNDRNTFDKRAFTIKEAAEYACVSRSTVENWLTKGMLPYEELPNLGEGKYRFRRVRRHDLDKFLERLYSGNDHDETGKADKKPIFLQQNS